VPISLSQQIPLALHRFLNLEADVDDNDNSIVGGGSGEDGLLLIPQIFFMVLTFMSRGPQDLNAKPGV